MNNRYAYPLGFFTIKSLVSWHTRSQISQMKLIVIFVGKCNQT
nr:MAG TPA: hypothetical protein [Caudoviricetes sp.]